MGADQKLRKEIREELEVRIKGRYYGHISPDEEDKEPDIVKLYLILADESCPGCEEALDAYKKEISAGDIEVHDVQTSEKAMEIVINLGLYALPALIGETQEGKYVVLDGGV
jgi:hypothetical protein